MQHACMAAQVAIYNSASAVQIDVYVWLKLAMDTNYKILD